MKTSKTFASLAVAIFATGLTTSVTQLSASASPDESALCINRKYETEFHITTENFYAAICSTGYSDTTSQCYIPTKYFYVANDRKTGKSIILPAVEEKNNISLYKAKNGNFTYQMATSGGYTQKPWTSLSVFLNGKKIYSRVVNSYYGFYDC